MVRKTTLAISVSALLASAAPAFASFDMEDCKWSDEHCLLKGDPVLTPGNDSRDNLLRLLSEAKSFTLPVQSIPADITRSRDVYFAYHPEWGDLEDPAPAAVDKPAEESPLNKQLAALQLEPVETDQDGEQENRFVSNNAGSLSQFFAALLADDSLTAEQRHALAQARLGLYAGASDEQISASLATLPADSTALLYKTYLTGAARFYAGDYEGADRAFAPLIDSDRPWLAETAHYMLMRTALNKSSQNSMGEYGDFTIDRIDRPAAEQAQKAAQAYLQRWPEGRYADSTRGMLRRINWYLQAWPQLAGLYEQQFQQAADAGGLRGLVIEYDNVYGMQFNGRAVREAFPDAPLISYIELLRALRLNSDEKPTLTQDDLNSSKPAFEQRGKLALWRNLQLNLWQATDNNAAILQAVKPAEQLPPHDILAFSEQVLYGEALMAQKQWPAARDFWLKLLKLSQDAEQQQYVQAKLAATLVFSGDTEAIFAADSAITNLRFRSRVLKTVASPERLRQQASQGPNNEERTIALHTLLVRDLTENRFSDWLKDRKLASAITHPVLGKAFDDVNLSAFDWNGDAAETGYVCRSLNETVHVLSQNANDAHALNCLGEFFRTSNTHVDLWKDSAGNDVLEMAIHRKTPYGQFDRQAYYQQVIAAPKAEPEDKSYALYRAIMCYAPSGMNECGGADVDKAQRKSWFSQLKTQYPGSPWAQKLKYYW
jgi:outer membrane protein assembly factor BamD (BamD/ComL family)